MSNRELLVQEIAQNCVVCGSELTVFDVNEEVCSLECVDILLYREEQEHARINALLIVDTSRPGYEGKPW